MLNPFQILNINQAATKAEVIHAVAKAMKERKNIQEIAEAQKILFDPKTRLISEFLYVLDSGLIQNREPRS